MVAVEERLRAPGALLQWSGLSAGAGCPANTPVETGDVDFAGLQAAVSATAANSAGTEAEVEGCKRASLGPGTVGAAAVRPSLPSFLIPLKIQPSRRKTLLLDPAPFPHFITFSIPLPPVSASPSTELLSFCRNHCNQP